MFWPMRNNRELFTLHLNIKLIFYFELSAQCMFVVRRGQPVRMDQVVLIKICLMKFRDYEYLTNNISPF